jgi:hypothetical protein
LASSLIDQSHARETAEESPIEEVVMAVSTQADAMGVGAAQLGADLAPNALQAAGLARASDRLRINVNKVG